MTEGERHKQLVDTLRLLFASLNAKQIAAAVHEAHTDSNFIIDELLNLDGTRVIECMSVSGVLRTIKEDRSHILVGTVDDIWGMIARYNIGDRVMGYEAEWDIIKDAESQGILMPWVHSSSCPCGDIIDTWSITDCTCDGRGDPEDKACPDESNTTPTSHSKS